MHSTSLSELCSDSADFFSWKRRGGVRVRLVPELPSDIFPRTLRRELALPQAALLAAAIDPIVFSGARYARDRMALYEGSVAAPDDPESLLSLWLHCSRAFQMFEDGKMMNGFYMRRGTDFMLEMIFNRDPLAFKVYFERQIWLPYVQDGPCPIAAVNTVVSAVLNVVNDTTLPSRCRRQLHFFKQPLGDEFEFSPVIIEYHIEDPEQARNKAIMDLVAMARYTGYIGLSGITLTTVSITPSGYYVFCTSPTPPDQTVEIAKYPERSLVTFCDFMRMCIFFTELRDLAKVQLEGKVVDAAPLFSSTPWKCDDYDEGHEDTGSDEGDDVEESTNGGDSEYQILVLPGPAKRRKTTHDADDEPSLTSVDDTQREPGFGIYHPTPARQSPIPSFLERFS
ncbi:hypothetical protein PENSPDRAFT_655752 [Peniophora sp. CONT]|nr:hypothetical protein PENSPDRAFT_655752 [Peniophora sp. CONT]